MELEIYKPTDGQPLPPVEWNFSAIKKWLEDGLEQYKGRVYDETQITQAKKDAATLRKLKAAIDGKRREVKSFYLDPYEAFCSQAHELTGMIDAQVDEISAQVKSFYAARKEEKRKRIETELYEPMIGKLAELVPYSKLHDPKWLNVTMSMSAVSEDLGGKIDRIINGLATIDGLDLDAGMAEQVNGVFLRSFDLASALAEKSRIEKQRESLKKYDTAESRENAPKSDDSEKSKYTHLETENTARTRYGDDNTAEPIHTIDLRIRVTHTKLKLLGEFMRENGIHPERI